MHFLIRVRKGLSPQALHDNTLKAVKQHYYRFYPTEEQPTAFYTVTEIGNLWFAKTLPVTDQDWLKREHYSFHTACEKATQEVLYRLFPPEQRHLLRGVVNNADKVKIAQESLLKQITILLTQPVGKLDLANYSITVFIERLQGFPALSQSLTGTFPFCSELLSPELYSAFDLTSGQPTETEYELAVTKIE